MPDSTKDDWGHWINAIIGSLALAGIVGGITTWNKGEMTAARVIALEGRLERAGEDRFTGRMGAAHDERVRGLEVAVAKMECKP